ncbi:MAG: sugar ABC transporter ATP-binding protein [Bacillota bacterium]|jgi:ribose transport system ATP-binding protein|nr:sugar ABC transporter ATP-binding protein [Bacillota bacterium]HHT90956.1 sugar ABC transporter ATP-binding protein [Bacillota bacterium]
MPELALQTKTICKTYGTVPVLFDVDFDLKKGEIHALIGENGAGKSTLVKILAGYHEQTSGELLRKGQPVRYHNTGAAEADGIVMIHQEFNLANDLDVEENIFLGKELLKRGLLDKAAMRQRSTDILDKLGTKIKPRTKVKDLSVSDKQMVEIAKALAFNSEVLIMDEPTAVLTTSEIDVLFRIIRALKDHGVSIIYISHKLDEVKELADRVTVLRDGYRIATEQVSDLSEDDMARLMVGRELSTLFPPKPDRSQAKPAVLDVQNVSCPKYVENASFTLYEGEILGFAGLIGAGRTELMECVVGLRRRSSGDICYRNQPLWGHSYADAIKNNVVYLSEDRKGKGLFTALPLAPNVTVLSLQDHVTKFGFLDSKKEEATLDRTVQEFEVRLPSSKAMLGMLSGGNQQKIALGKMMQVEPDIVILDEPTRGIDVGTKQQVYRFVRELVKQGKSCILISSELSEIIGLSDRVIVMRSGRIVGELLGDEINEEEIMLYATGIKGGVGDEPSDHRQASQA